MTPMDAAMKNPIFENMGPDYPIHLEQGFPHVIAKIEELWGTAEIHDYLSDLIIDKRGGRKGFPEPVSKDIVAIREFRMLETLRQVERKEEAVRELQQRGVVISQQRFQLLRNATIH